MIAHHTDLPLLQLQDGTLATLDKEWLNRGILAAARRAGYSQWWLADHIGASVMQYFTHRIAEKVIPIDRVVGAVREVLDAVGYTDVAGEFVPELPPVCISLRVLAETIGPGGELHFFGCLTREIIAAVETSSRGVRLEEMRLAVKTLLGAKNWRRNCDELCETIVNFASERFREAVGRGTVSLTITL